MQHSSSISSCWQPSLPLLSLAEGYPSALDDEVPFDPTLCLFMVFHYQHTRSVMQQSCWEFYVGSLKILTHFDHLTGERQRRIWVLSYVIATALVLVPAPLIEFRYYTIPFYFLILHSKIGETSNWLLIGSLYAVVNIFTMYLFLFRPFHWDHEPGTQRFIW